MREFRWDNSFRQGELSEEQQSLYKVINKAANDAQNNYASEEFDGLSMSMSPYHQLRNALLDRIEAEEVVTEGADGILRLDDGSKLARHGNNAYAFCLCLLGKGDEKVREMGVTSVSEREEVYASAFSENWDKVDYDTYISFCPPPEELRELYKDTFDLIYRLKTIQNQITNYDLERLATEINRDVKDLYAMIGKEEDKTFSPEIRKGLRNVHVVIEDLHKALSTIEEIVLTGKTDSEMMGELFFPGKD